MTPRTKAVALVRVGVILMERYGKPRPLPGVPTQPYVRLATDGTPRSLAIFFTFHVNNLAVKRHSWSGLGGNFKFSSFYYKI